MLLFLAAAAEAACGDAHEDSAAERPIFVHGVHPSKLGYDLKAIIARFEAPNFPEDRWKPKCGKGRPGSPSASPQIRWQEDLPGPKVNAAEHAESAAPVVIGDVILVGSAGGRALYVVSRQDGTLVHAYPAEGSVSSAPAVDLATGNVYFGDTAGSVWAYDSVGNKLWSWQSGAPVVGTPVLADGRIYATNVDDTAFALDAGTGAVAWQYRQKPDRTRETDLALYSSPPMPVVDGVAYGAFSDGTVVALNATSGDVLWSKRIGEGRYPDLVAPPLVWGGDLYVAGYFGPLLALDAKTQAVRWRVDLGAAAAALPGEDAGVRMLYQPDSNGGLHAIVALTGAEKWIWSSGTEGAVTTPVQTHEGLWIGSSDGSFYLIDAGTGKLKWQWREAAALEGVSAPPDVDGRDLYLVTNAGRLYDLAGFGEDAPAGGLAWGRRD
jgi:outer membrane protein assembly factor BamB